MEKKDREEREERKESPNEVAQELESGLEETSEDVGNAGEESEEEAEVEETPSEERSEKEKGLYVLEPDYDAAVNGALSRIDGLEDASGFGEELRRALESMANEINEGRVSEETALLMAQGLDYSRAVNNARNEGETVGRNAQIEERLREDMDTDGVPHPGCGQGAPIRRRASSIFDLAREAL